MTRNALTQIVRCVAFMLSLLITTGCVHEWPDPGGNTHRVRLHIYYDPPTTFWDQYDMVVNRGETAAYTDRYHLKVYRDGDKDRLMPVAEYNFTRGGIERTDFVMDIDLPPGDYELYAWSDWADAGSYRSLFFDTSDFSQIVYSEPYNGNNELRDAFRGQAKLHIDYSIEADYEVMLELPLERPLARYEFIATDLGDFVEIEETRGVLTYESRNSKGVIKKVPDFSRYTVKMVYTGFMPSKFDNFKNKPIDSRTGISYDARIKMIDQENARLGFDYVMVNGKESSVAVALEVYGPDGKLLARSNPINVETKRNRNTTVRGRFLTTKATGGIGINPDFDGEYNIEIK